jgi:phosphohistidine phosphatase SixA
MKTAYLVRHGDADYVNDELTDLGHVQVRLLINVLDPRLPPGTYALVSSLTKRTRQTAEKIQDFLETRRGCYAEIIPEEMITQRGWVDDDNMIAKGKESLSLLKEYDGNGDHLFLVSHDRVLVSMANAMSEKYGIGLPEGLRIRDKGSYSIKSTDTEERIPRMDYASALFFDFESDSFEYLRSF